MTIDKSKFLKTIGWTTVGIGLYLVGISTTYESESVDVRYDDDIIDADYTIIED